jgi:hypothetical protein
VRSEAAGAVEKLDRATAVRREALLDLARLLGGVDVQRQTGIARVACELLEPVGRAGADGVGGDADADSLGPERLQLPQLVDRRLLAHPREAAARVGGEQEHELDPGLGGRLGSGARLVEPEVVELPDRGVAGRDHLPVGRRVERADAGRCLLFRLGEHRLPPRPEVAAPGAAA